MVLARRLPHVQAWPQAGAVPATQPVVAAAAVKVIIALAAADVVGRIVGIIAFDNIVALIAANQLVAPGGHLGDVRAIARGDLERVKASSKKTGDKPGTKES